MGNLGSMERPPWWEASTPGTFFVPFMGLEPSCNQRCAVLHAQPLAWNRHSGNIYGMKAASVQWFQPVFGSVEVQDTLSCSVLFWPPSQRGGAGGRHEHPLLDAVYHGADVGPRLQQPAAACVYCVLTLCQALCPIQDS